MAMLGEIVVHGEDIRRPLGLAHRSPSRRWSQWRTPGRTRISSSAPKRRIAGLQLRATDTDWSHGVGPEVVGPLQSLVVAMTGRKGSHADLSGEGRPTLSARS